MVFKLPIHKHILTCITLAASILFISLVFQLFRGSDFQILRVSKLIEAKDGWGSKVNLPSDKIPVKNKNAGRRERNRIESPAVYFKPGQGRTGLGNQLFSYACAYAVSRKNNWPLYLNVPKGGNERQFGPLDRHFALDYFNIPLDESNTLVDGSFDLSNVVAITDEDILHGNYPKTKVVQINAFCQSEYFFSPYKEEILELFKMKIDTEEVDIKEWLTLIQGKDESVSVHVRRGDLKKVKNRVIQISYYREAMLNISKMLREKGKPPKFFVFSDDMDFVKRELLYPESNEVARELQQFEVHFVTGMSSVKDFFLMSKSKHNIIPCSSFSWWAAYLNTNPEKIVIAAHHFQEMFNRMDYHYFQYRYIFYPLKWITVDAPFY